ncbi:hypothetical protein [uncultured Chloroflexus sp.]|uniref:hypothetical protein n=1 Tax=uncultured Chloroflexus sp. TaxID=214040 RepID=UPI002635BD31|nr:hypothetical protein [uncultured Chloroflexus sp.]
MTKQPTSRPNHNQRWIQRWFERTLFGLIGTIFTTQIGLAMYLWLKQPAEPFLIGEWLINYQGGFVRRGLLGEIIIQLSRRIMIDPVKTVIVVQIGIGALFLLLTYILLRQTNVSIITATLFFSPAFLRFLLVAWLIVGVRKEMLFSIIFLIHLLSLRTNYSFSPILPLFIGTSTIVVILSHEMLVILLPYLLIASLCYERQWGRISYATAIAIIPASIVASIIIQAPHTTITTIDHLCAALESNPPRDCIDRGHLGAITFLTKTVLQSIQFTQSLITSEAVQVYLITGLLSIVPLIITIVSYRLWQFLPKQTLMWVGGLWGLSLATTIPLFFVAVDYGRFIHIHITCSTFLLAWFLQLTSAPLSAKIQHSMHGWRASVLLVFFIGFIGSWRLPVWLGDATYTNAFRWIWQ